MKLTIKKEEDKQIESKVPINEPKLFKFITEYILYPNGKLYFSKQYPIGEERYKQKKLDKEFFIADIEETEEEF